jgi:hypothetical protein
MMNLQNFKKELVGYKDSVAATVFSKVLIIITVICCLSGQAFPLIVRAEPLTPDEIEAVNLWPNWVADACSGGTGTDTGSLSAGSGAPNGAEFPNLDPTSMATSIDSFIKKQNPNSEMKGLGATIVASAKNANVNPFLIAAIAAKESSMSDPSDYNVSHGNNSFGREAAPGQPSFQGAHSWYKWTSVKASVDYTAPENKNASGGGDEASYLRAQYAGDINGNDIVGFFLKYAPPSENDTATYTAQVKGWIDDMVQGAGSAPATPDSNGQSASGCSCSGSSSTDLVGSDNQQKIFNYFLGKGLSPAQAAGITGNFGQESGYNPSSPGGYLAQWGGGRLTALEALAQKDNKPVTDLGVQLDYVWLELTGGPGAGEDDSAVLQHLKGSNTASDAATIFSNEYERPGDPQLQNRIDYANDTLSKYGSFAGGAGSGSPCGGVVNCNGSVPGATGLSDTRRNVVCLVQQELQAWNQGDMKPGFRPNSQDSFSKYSQNSNELWCADFASWVYEQANYPLQQAPIWRIPAVQSIQSIGEQNNQFHWHPSTGSYTPKPGDLAIYGGSHVNIVTKVQGNNLTVVGGDQNADSSGYPDGSKVSEYPINGFSGGGITGYVSPD